MKFCVYPGVKSEEVAGVDQGNKCIPGKGSSMCTGAELRDGPVHGKQEECRRDKVYREEVGWAILQVRNRKLREMN